MADDNPLDLAPKPLEITITPHDRPNAAAAPENPLDLAPSSPANTTPATTTGGGKPLENAPGDTETTSTLKDLGAGALTGMSTLAGGMGGDMVNAARNLAAGLYSLTPGEGRTTKQILDEWNASRDVVNQERIKQIQTMQKPSWSHATDAQWEQEKQRRIAALQINHGSAPTTQDVYEHSVVPKTGEHVSTNPWSAYARAGVSGAIPGLIGGPVGATAGLVGGVVGQATSDLNPFWSTALPLAAGAVTPLAGKGVATGRRGLLGPNKTEQATAAADLLKQNTANPNAAIKAADTRAGLPDETLAQATLDRGHAKAQDTLLTAGQPDMVAAVQQAQEGRTAAMTGALQRISPDSAPEDVSAAIKQHHDVLSKNLADNPEPTAPPQDESGAAQAKLQRDNNQAAKDELDKFKDTIDPTRKMGFWAGNDKDYAAAELDRARTEPDLKRNEVVDDYLTRVTKWGDVKSFRDSMDFVRGLNEDIGQLMKTGNTTAARDLIRLKEQIEKSQDSAVENQHKTEQTLAQRGEINPDDTLASNFQRAADDWQRQRQQTNAGANRGAGTAANTAGRTEGVPGVGGAARAAGEGSPDAAGNQGIPGQLEPLDADAVARLNLYKAGHGARKDLFENSPAAAVTDAADFDVKGNVQAGAKAAEAAFKPGAGGFQIAQSVLNTGGAEALANMKDMAIGRLQEELKGKPLDQKALDAFKTKHADALRAIDDKEPGFSDQFNDAATARTNVQNFENSAAARFLGKEPGDIVNHASSLLKARDSTPIRDLIQQAQTLPNGDAIIGGLRRAAAQAMENEFEVAGPRGIINALRNRRANLDAMFEPGAVADMEKAADSFKRSQLVQSLARRTVGSPTAERTAGMGMLQAQMKAAAAHDAHNGVLDMSTAMVAFEMLSHIGGSIMHGDIAGAGLGGVGLAGTLLIKPMLERALAKRGAKAQANIYDMFSRGLASREVGKAMLMDAVDVEGRPNQLAIDTLADALIGTEAGQQQQRESHASGGRVGDHSAAAKHLISMVDKARKMDTERTKPLLKVNDHAVATALAAANRSI